MKIVKYFVFIANTLVASELILKLPKIAEISYQIPKNSMPILNIKAFLCAFASFAGFA